MRQSARAASRVSHLGETFAFTMSVSRAHNLRAELHDKERPLQQVWVRPLTCRVQSAAVADLLHVCHAVNGQSVPTTAVPARAEELRAEQRPDSSSVYERGSLRALAEDGETFPKCPSSGALRQFGAFVAGGSGSVGFQLRRLSSGAAIVVV